MVFLYCMISDKSSTIGVRAMASKTTTTTKFEVEKFDRKSNFLLWKMQVTLLLMKEGTIRPCLVLRRSIEVGGW